MSYLARVVSEPRRAVSPQMCAYGRTLAEPRLSPCGTWVVFLSQEGPDTKLVRVAGDGGPELVLTADPAPARSHPSGGGVLAWHPDGGSILFVGADSGLWRIGVDGGPCEPVLAAPVEGLWGPAISPDGTRVAYTVEQHSIWVAPLDGTGPPIPIETRSGFVLDVAWLDDEELVWQAWDVPAMPWDQSRLEAGRPSNPGGSRGPGHQPRVIVAAPGMQCQQPMVHPTGGLAFLSDISGWLNVHRLVGDDLRAVVGEPFEHGGPTWGDRQRTMAWSPDGRRIAFCRNESGFGRLCVVDLDDGAVSEVAKAVHLSIDWRGDRLVALRSGGCTPTQLVAYDTTSWERTVLARGPVGGFEPALVEPTVETFAALDGATLHARRYEPAGGADRMICWLHGGPTDQWPVEFNARIAFFLDAGWGVLVPDHRGSSGHGRAYAQALRGRWGDLDVADTVAAVDAIVERGWADTVVAMGGSAGGFTVLNLMSRHPGVLAAGVVAFPVSDLLSLAQTTHRFEAHYCDSLVGPLPSSKPVYRRRSVHPESIVDPLLILHGDADRVVSIEQSRSLATALVALGRDVELVEYAGEGHGWRQPATMVDELTRVETFLDAHAKGGAR